MSSFKTASRAVTDFRASAHEHKVYVDHMEMGLAANVQALDQSVQQMKLTDLEQDMLDKLEVVVGTASRTQIEVLAKLELWYEINCSDNDVSHLSATELLVVSALEDLRLILNRT